MEQLTPDRRQSAPSVAPSAALRAASIVLYCAVAAVLIAVLLGRSYRPDFVPILAGVVLVLLGFLIVLNARFLSLARKKHRDTSGALYVSEREFQSVFENALDGILLHSPLKGIRCSPLRRISFAVSISVSHRYSHGTSSGVNGS